MRISDWSSDVCSSDLDWADSSSMAEDSSILLTLGNPGDATGMSSFGEDYSIGSVKQDGIAIGAFRSAERRVGKLRVSTCRSRWSTEPGKNKREQCRKRRVPVTEKPYRVAN